MRRTLFVRSSADRRGMALVIALGAVVLLTTLILTFFTSVRLNRQVSFSAVNQVRADQVARAALEVVTGGLRDEVADSSLSSTNLGGGAYPLTYAPLSATNALPAKVGVSGGASTNLYKVSANGLSIDPGRNARPLGSSISIAAASVNGRLISQSRWFGSGGPMLGANGELPTWVYVTRGGVTTPAPSDAVDASKPGYVVGRFAYTVYGTGGLLDANAAGNPGSTTFRTNAAFKSSVGDIDLSAAGVSTNISAWRNPPAGSGADLPTFLEWSAGIRPAGVTATSSALAAFASGHLSAAVGDNAFFSRHDLLLAAQNKAITGFDTNQAPLLTHFSRSLNAPSAQPATLSATNPNLADVRFSKPGTVTHYDDTGATAPSYTVQAGDPLLQRRFSLAKLAWITSSGPAHGASASAIQACFGLKYGSTSIGGVATPCWQYVGSPGAIANPPTPIETLSQVAAEGREPNFFELLKAGILEGSIGKASDDATLAQASQRALESSKEFQTFQIGVNIIDCAGADNYPTTIAYAQPAITYTAKNLTSTAPTATVAVHGVKDLPYLYGMANTAFHSLTYVDPTHDMLNYASCVMTPLLFNPNAKGIAPTSGTQPPIRVRIAGGTLTAMITSLGWGSAAFPEIVKQNFIWNLHDNPLIPPIIISSGALESFRNGMSAPQGADADAASQLKQIVNSSYMNNTYQTYHSFLFYDVGSVASYANPPQNSTSTTIVFRTGALSSSVMIVLEYQDTAGWHVYDTMVGNEGYTTGGLWPTVPDFAPQNVKAAAGTTRKVNYMANAGNNSSGFIKLDPRTTRFGVSSLYSVDPTTTPLITLTPSKGTTFAGVGYSPPFGNAAFVSALDQPGNQYFPADWVEGDKTSGWTDTTYSPNVADPDGTLRPADGWLLKVANAPSFLPTVSNALPSSTGPASGRPIILHRPYRSVAELGYVFRGSPWKSLSFFDETSADGALLDLFSVADEPAVVAGRVDLNSPQAAVQQALLSGVGQAYDGSNPMSSSTASTIAGAYHKYAYGTGTTPVATTTVPESVAQLPVFMGPSLTAVYPAATQPIKSYREAVVRGLTAGTQTRTWNFLIDVVAQVGRFPAGSVPTSLANFAVEGERRYWLSVAIDRYTGKVVSQQLEPAYE